MTDEPEDILEVQIMNNVIELFRLIPNGTKDKAMSLIRKQCYGDRGAMALRRIVRLMPTGFYSNSIPDRNIINCLVQCRKLLNFKYGHEA